MTKNLEDRGKTVQFLFQRAEPLANTDKIQDLIIAAQQGDMASRNRLMMMHIRYIVKVAGEYTSRVFSLSDLIHEGCMGFMTAVDKFDASRGVKLLTYANYWIRQKITMKLFKYERFIRVPMSRYRSWKKEETTYQAQGGNLKPISRDRLPQPAMNSQPFHPSMLSVLSLDDSFESPENLYSCTSHPDVESPEQILMGKELQNSLVEVCRFLLSSREQEILNSRYGLLNHKKMTFKELGQRFSISKERVRQIELRALKKLQSSLVAKRKLVDFLQTSI